MSDADCFLFGRPGLCGPGSRLAYRRRCDRSAAAVAPEFHAGVPTSNRVAWSSGPATTGSNPASRTSWLAVASADASSPASGMPGAVAPVPAAVRSCWK